MILMEQPHHQRLLWRPLTLMALQLLHPQILMEDHLPLPPTLPMGDRLLLAHPMVDHLLLPHPTVARLLIPLAQEPEDLVGPRLARRPLVLLGQDQACQSRQLLLLQLAHHMDRHLLTR